MSSQDLQPEKSRKLLEFEEEEEDPVYFACRNCGGKHTMEEGRTCENGGEQE